MERLPAAPVFNLKLETSNLKLFAAREQNCETITGGSRMIMLKSKIE
jgi:hypothetical protein